MERTKKSLEDRDILFSHSDKREFVNYIYVLAKHFIQNIFVTRIISIEGFISLLKKTMLSEIYISFINDRIGKFFKKLISVYNYFFPQSDR